MENVVFGMDWFIKREIKKKGKEEREVKDAISTNLKNFPEIKEND